MYIPHQEISKTSPKDPRMGSLNWEIVLLHPHFQSRMFALILDSVCIALLFAWYVIQIELFVNTPRFVVCLFSGWWFFYYLILINSKRNIWENKRGKLPSVSKKILLVVYSVIWWSFSLKNNFNVTEKFNHAP